MQGLRIVAAGVAVGSVLALGAAKAVSGALYGVSFIDRGVDHRHRDVDERGGPGERRARAPHVCGRSLYRAAVRVTNTRVNVRQRRLTPTMKPVISITGR